MLRPLKSLLTNIQKYTNGLTQATTMNDTTKTLNISTNSSNNDDSELSLNDKTTEDESASSLNETSETDLSLGGQNSSILENSFEKCHVISIDLDENYEVQSQSEEPELSAGDLININDDPLADPLIVDQFSESNIESLRVRDKLLSPTEGESSADENVLYIIDVEDIKEKNIKLDHQEKVDDKEKPIGISDEQEIRSDGSDSGLGSETSILQLSTTCSSNTPKTTPSSSKVNSSNLKRRSAATDGSDPTKRPKRFIQFDNVSVYYFPRVQGFGCVPSQGGCTLGMGSRHVNYKQFTLSEHAAEQRRAHKQQMQDINPRGSSSEESDSDDEFSEASGSDLDADTNGFLQPVTARQRRALLKAAGVRKIDSSEKEDCRAIRSSREFCGCSCRGYCDPDTCACSQAGIKCQVDRPNFPCGCTRDGCANVIGRVEFNPDRVRRHFIHTITRLNLERRELKIDLTDCLASPTKSHLLLSYNNSNFNTILDSSQNTLKPQYYEHHLQSASSSHSFTQNTKVYSNQSYDEIHHPPHPPGTSSGSNSRSSSTYAPYVYHDLDFQSRNNHQFYSYSTESYGNLYQNENYTNNNNNIQNYTSNYQSFSESSTNFYSCASTSANPATLSTVETYDLTENATNYINLNTPQNSSTEVDGEIEFNTSIPATVQIQFTDDPLPLRPTTMAQSATQCSLASSAQTSTSVNEGTSTAMTSPINSTSMIRSTIFPEDTGNNYENLVDLTNEKSSPNKTEPFKTEINDVNSAALSCKMSTEIHPTTSSQKEEIFSGDNAKQLDNSILNKNDLIKAEDNNLAEIIDKNLHGIASA